MQPIDRLLIGSNLLWICDFRFAIEGAGVWEEVLTQSHEGREQAFPPMGPTGRKWSCAQRRRGAEFRICLDRDLLCGLASLRE